MQFRRLTLMAAACLALAAGAVCATAGDATVGDIVVSQAWSRATPRGARIGGGYLTIENRGGAPDRLVGATAEIAGKVEVHEMSMDNGVMKMRPLPAGLAIDPGKTVTLAPGGYHLMMTDLKAPLKEGDTVPVTLEFEKAGKVTLSLDVEALGAERAGSAAPDTTQKMHDHSGKM